MPFSLNLFHCPVRSYFIHIHPTLVIVIVPIFIVVTVNVVLYKLSLASTSAPAPPPTSLNGCSSHKILFYGPFIYVMMMTTKATTMLPFHHCAAYHHVFTVSQVFNILFIQYYGLVLV